MTEISCIATVEGHTKSIESIAFHSNAPIFATGSKDKTVKLWNLSHDGTVVTLNETLKSDDIIYSVAFHPNELILAAGTQYNTAELWNLSPDNFKVTKMVTIQDKTLNEFEKNNIFSVSFHPIKLILATGNKDGTADLWSFSFDNSDSKRITHMYQHEDWVRSVAFHPKKSILATGSEDNTVKLWKFSLENKNNKSPSECVATLERRNDNSNNQNNRERGHTDTVYSVAFHPIINILATGSGDQTAKLWSFSSNFKNVTCKSTLVGHENSVFSVAFHPNALILATGSKDNTAKLWNFSRDGKTVTCISTIEGHSNSVNSVAFHPKLPILATGSADNTAKLWKFNIENISELITHKIIIEKNRNGVNKIIIPSELLLDNNNNINNSCPDFTDLYNQIMKQKLSNKFKFEYEGQISLDYGGLTRDMFDKLLPIYTRRFFESIEDNFGFLILKKIEDMPIPPQGQVKNKSKENISDIKWNILIEETEQMIILAKAAKIKIFLRINPRLLDLLQSDNYKIYFNNSKKNLKNLKKSYEDINFVINEVNNINKERFLVNNNSRTIIKRFKEEKNENLKKVLKSEIRLRRFAIEFGFKTWEQLDKMFIFIQNFWEKESDIFTSNLKYDIESFIERLNIFQEKIVKNSNGDNNSKIEKILIPIKSFGELSFDKKKFIFKKEFDQEFTKLFTEYSLFLSMLQFILGPESNDTNRKLFISYVTGSSYYQGDLEIVLRSRESTIPFIAHTCFYYIDFFKKSSNQLNINNKDKFIRNEINPKPRNLNFGLI